MCKRNLRNGSGPPNANVILCQDKPWQATGSSKNVALCEMRTKNREKNKKGTGDESKVDVHV